MQLQVPCHAKSSLFTEGQSPWILSGLLRLLFTAECRLEELPIKSNCFAQLIAGCEHPSKAEGHSSPSELSCRVQCASAFHCTMIYGLERCPSILSSVCMSTGSRQWSL